MNLIERIDAFVALGKKIKTFLNAENDDKSVFLNEMLQNCYYNNRWFDDLNTRFALNQIAQILDIKSINKWLGFYDISRFNNKNPQRIGVVMAGNIPMVGFHDFLCVLIAGHIFIGKLSSQDKILMPFIAELLFEIDERFKKNIFFKENLRDGFDAIIATGSNNSSRYFEYYFSKYPNIIRKSRNSIAILSGNENKSDLESLADDICIYFGKGCRSVSKIYTPENYNFQNLFSALDKFKYLNDNIKYYNNYEYYKSIYIINNTAFKDNGFMILKNQKEFSSPVSVLFYEYYNNIQDVNSIITENLCEIQCVVSNIKDIENHLDFGSTQKPALWEYADNIDTFDFLLNL